MKLKLTAVLFSSLLLNPVVTPVADACGVKLTVKSGGPRRAVARSSNPSQVLLVGKPPRRLERDLVEAGHKVEVARTPAEAKQKPYAVVVTDTEQQNDARARYPNAVILVRSSDPGADVRLVETQVRRNPNSTSATADGTAIAAATKRAPLARGGGIEKAKPINSSDNAGATDAGGGGERVAVADTQPKAEAKVAAKVEPKVEAKVEPKVEAKVEAKIEPKVAVVEPKRQPKVEPKIEPKNEPKIEAKIEPKVEAKVEPKTEPTVDTAEPKTPKAKAVASFANGELYFGLGVDQLNEHHASLDKAAKWLNASPDVNVVIEGHADPTGSADANLTLSERRAQWVKDQLVSRGVDASRLEVTGFGDTKLKYGRADGRNRRVAIVPKQ